MPTGTQISGHAGDREAAAVDAHAPSHDLRIATESMLPTLITNDREWVGSLRRFIGREEAARRGAHSKNCKEVLGDHLAPDHVGRAAAPGHNEVDRRADHASETVEGAAAIAEVEIIPIGELCGKPRLFVDFEQPDEPRWFGGRHGAQQQAVHVAKDHSVHPNAYAKRERDGDCEAGCASHRAKRISYVGAEIVEPARAASVAHLLPIPIEPTERDQRSAARLGAIDPELVDESLRLHLHVEVKLLFHARFGGARANDGTNAGGECREPDHGLLLAFEHECHRGGEAIPLVHFFAECFPSVRGERVVARAAIVHGGLPGALDPAAMLEALQRGIERSLIDVESSAGDLLNAESDSPAVHWLEGEGLEDEEVDAAAECVGFLRMSLGHASLFS
jgi:hypothetical protein